MSRYVDLSERVTAQYYDAEYEEWTQETTTIAEILDSVCDDYTVLPSTQPQRIKGKWIQDSYYDEKYVCDKCGEPCATYINGKPRDKYCKWCGADMKGEQDG